MLEGNYKTQLCWRYSRGHCDKGDKCSYAHGETDMKQRCHKGGVNCPYGTKCYFVHHPTEVEFFKWRENQNSPKIMVDASTQTEEHREIIYTPPLEFCDVVFTLPEKLPPPSQELLTPAQITKAADQKENESHDAYLLRKRKNTAMSMIRRGEKTLADFNHTTWRSAKQPHLKPRKEKTPKERREENRLATRKCRAEKLIKEGMRKRSDFDKNYYQKERHAHKIISLAEMI
jgi:hypothetical protein